MTPSNGSTGQRRAGRLLAALSLGLAWSASPAFAQYAVDWYTVDGGGAQGIPGGTFTLGATIGQPDASAAIPAGTFTLSGGFWGAAAPPPGPTADLSLTMSDSPDPVMGLQSLTYTLSISNAGPSTATSVSVSHTLPAGAVFVSGGGSGWSCSESGGIVSCTRASLAVAAAPPLSVVVTAPSTGGPLQSAASVTASETDPDPSDNSDTETTTLNSVPTAELAITKAATGEAVWGRALGYTIAVTNNGPNAANGATVTDVFPSSLTSVSWTCAASGGSSCPASGSGNISTLVNLLSGGTATFSVSTTVVVGAAGPIVNTASVAAPGGVADPVLSNNSDTETTPLKALDFFTVSPCRVVDTRGPEAPALDAGGDRVFVIAGKCDIPSTAVAISVNLAVTQPAAAGNLRLYPAGTTVPTVSSLNYSANQTRGNNAIVSLGALGDLAVRCAQGSGTAHFILDVNGYFE